MSLNVAKFSSDFRHTAGLQRKGKMRCQACPHNKQAKTASYDSLRLLSSCLVIFAMEVPISQ